MSSASKLLEPAFQGVGQKPGTEIWRIENFQPVPVPKEDSGKFYSGDSYVILQTSPGKGGGAYLYDIHFWMGKDTSQDEAGTAAIKSVELDSALGGRAVQHRELQGHESDKFLSYFKPCILPLEGGVASGFKKPQEEEFETRLYVCRGKRFVKLKQVPFSRSSLNHDDVFILDTESKVYQFNGANSNIQERAKALEVIQFLKDKHHEGKCDVAIVDDGNLKTESDSGEFWVLFGGFAPIGKKIIGEDDVVAERTAATLHSINDGHFEAVEGGISKGMLENDKCYLLDCGADVFVWVGRTTQVEDRKAACHAAEDYISSQGRPKSTHLTRVIQGYEPYQFKSNFDSWPSGPAAVSGVEESRGKVAALVKQQGAGAKGAPKSSAVCEDPSPLLESGGKIEVWRVSGGAKHSVPKDDVGKFYSGDCYIVLYTYHSSERKEEYFLCYWIGKDSTEGDQTVAADLSEMTFNSLKGRPALCRVYQGKEPLHLTAIFGYFVILKGGESTGYRDMLSGEGRTDETYSSDKVALIHVSETSAHNFRAVQVDTVSASLNSHDCFLLQSGPAAVFIWQGSQSSPDQHQSAIKFAEFLKPGVTVKHAKEGTENSAFWSALGGKQSFTSRKNIPEIIRDPHLYTYSFSKAGKFEVEEVYNFAQDDLLTEDMLILSTHAEVFVWIGQSVDSKEKHKALDIGQKYVEMASVLEGLSRQTPLYKITEGNEPVMFTTYFAWDAARAAVIQGSSFQKKVALLMGGAAHDRHAAGSSNQGGPTQRASALAALSSAFNPGQAPNAPPPPPRGSSDGSSQRAAAVAALSSVLTAETNPHKKRSPDSPRSPPPGTVRGTPNSFSSPSSPFADELTPSPIRAYVDGETIAYDRLISKSANPASAIDLKRRETYLSDEEFETVLGMNRDAFYQLPRWKQDMQKRKVDLF